MSAKRILSILIICLIATIVQAGTRVRWDNNVQIFYDDSASDSPIVRPMGPSYLDADFHAQGIISSTGSYASVAYTSGFADPMRWTATGSGPTDGSCEIVASTSDQHLCANTATDMSDTIHVYSGLEFTAGVGACLEARVRSNAGSCAVNIGFTDAQTEAADTLPVLYNATTLLTTASDCALFLWDNHATTSVLYCLAVDTDVDGTLTSSGVTPAADEWYVVRINLNEDGDADFWLDGNHVYKESTGITPGTALCAYAGILSEATGSSHKLDIDYLRVWTNTR